MPSNQSPVRRLRVQLPSNADAQQQRIGAVVRRQIESRCDARLVDDGGDFLIRFALDPARRPECFEVRRPTGDSVVITGGDGLGLLYGAGRFLRGSRYPDGGFVPGDWEGLSQPAKPLRGIYFATHFHNFYHDAPIERVVEYLQDLALWGFNTVQLWYDLHHYTGIDDPAAQSMIARLRAIMEEAKALGLRIGLLCLGNEAYKTSPEPLRADFNTGRAIYKKELCPNKPGAMELLLAWFGEALDAFADLSPDLLTFWPYDQGGCACERCRPWGANGFLKASEAKARLARERFPAVKICLSTWLFDHGRSTGEWQGLADAFAADVDWCDYLQAESHETFPAFPLQRGVPGNLPLINFPEISMWQMDPWGGFGANPLPRRLQSLWEPIKAHVAGGFPYSEGIYEDINKILYAQFYWDPDRTADSILREYIAFEFGPAVVDEVVEMVATLEANQNHHWPLNGGLARQNRRRILYAHDPKRAFAQARSADTRMTSRARQAWRWRVVYLRALIDQELQPTAGFWASPACEQAFRELTAIYHAHNAETPCVPPTHEAVNQPRAPEHLVQL